MGRNTYKETFNGSTLTLTFSKWFCHILTKASPPSLKPQKNKCISHFINRRTCKQRKNSKIRKTQIRKPAYFFLGSNVFYSFDFWKSRFVTLQWLTQQSNLVAALKIEPDSSGAPSDPTQPRSQMLISKTFRKTKFEKCFRSHKPRNTRGAIVCTDSFILIDTCLLRIFSLFLPKAYFTL